MRNPGGFLCALGGLRREKLLDAARRRIGYFALRVYLISTPFHSGTAPKLR